MCQSFKVRAGPSRKSLGSQAVTDWEELVGTRTAQNREGWLLLVVDFPTVGGELVALIRKWCRRPAIYLPEPFLRNVVVVLQ